MNSLIESKKSAFLSKTLWVNLIMAVVAILSAQWPVVSEYVNGANVAMLFSVVNMVLRMVTKDKLFFRE